MRKKESTTWISREYGYAKNIGAIKLIRGRGQGVAACLSAFQSPQNAYLYTSFLYPIPLRRFDQFTLYELTFLQCHTWHECNAFDCPNDALLDGLCLLI